MLYLVLATLFLLAEIGFEMFSKGHRFYVLTASCLFITTIVFTGSITIAMFFGRLAEVTISPIEIFVGVALGIYALCFDECVVCTVYQCVCIEKE